MRCRACREARTGRTRCPASASPPGSPSRRSSIGSSRRGCFRRPTPNVLASGRRGGPECWVIPRERRGPQRMTSGRDVPYATAAEPGSVPGSIRRRPGGSDGDRERPHARPPLGVRAGDADRRSRRRRLDRGRGRPPVPRRDERRLDGGDPGPRPARHHRRRAGTGRDARLRPQRTPHQPGAGAPRRGARRRRARGVHPRAVHGERRRRERDGDPDRPQLSRRARRHRPMAGDLARTGVPRPDDADAGAHRSSRDARPVRSLSAATSAHPSEHVALRPVRRGRTRGVGPGAGGGGSGERLRVLLRGDQRRRAPGLHTARSVLGGARGAARPLRVPRVLRRGRDGGRTDRSLVRGSGDGVRPRHHRDREGARRGVRGDRRRSRPRARVRGVRPGLASLHPRPHVGRCAARMRRRARRPRGDADRGAGRARARSRRPAPR